MSLSRNLKSIITKIIVSDGRLCSFRFYSDEANDENKKEVDPTKDRTKVIPIETSMKYLQSKAYNETYSDKPVWILYRRNHKGGFAPRKTRKSCVRNGMISTGNPCPICRDEYLVLDAFKTGLCRKKQKELLVAIEQAWDQGYLTYDVPFREYDYSLYTNTTVNKQ
ncbi:unnamed protein product [Leptidea sinapis]|uniref:28S ribosomal protein S18b, mitochondrial n=1 Tax=Leptidea sinapis TaxID=189913 RepID=A0A5E4R851_9NEOP|nr:unnamed protein product [Leptidea sinapis]